MKGTVMALNNYNMSVIIECKNGTKWSIQFHLYTLSYGVPCK
jgi:hypothetical protein